MADALIYELGKESLQRLIKLHPELIETFALTLAELSLEQERAASVDGTIKPGEIGHIKNIYIGQLEANYGNTPRFTSH